MIAGPTTVTLSSVLTTDRKTERQKDRKTERQKDRKTERQKDRKTERQALRSAVSSLFFIN